MEQQTLSIAKAGLITTLTTRTSIFGSMNPKGNPKDSIAEQTSLSGPLLSRFDILLPVHDVKNAEQDDRVAEHILNNHQMHQAPAEQVHVAVVYLWVTLEVTNGMIVMLMQDGNTDFCCLGPRCSLVPCL